MDQDIVNAVESLQEDELSVQTILDVNSSYINTTETCNLAYTTLEFQKIGDTKSILSLDYLNTGNQSEGVEEDTNSSDNQVIYSYCLDENAETVDQDGSESHICLGCGKTYRNYFDLRYHQDYQSKNVECETCGQVFCLKLILKNHVKEVHKIGRSWKWKSTW